MTLARKGSRRITVGGAAYRWVVSPDSGYMVLVAEAAAGGGQRLEAVFGYGDVSDPGGLVQRRSIGPGAVRAVIAAALGRGWRPAAQGLPAFRVPDADRLVPVAGDE